MIPSLWGVNATAQQVYQRGLVIDSQLARARETAPVSVKKGIGD